MESKRDATTKDAESWPKVATTNFASRFIELKNKAKPNQKANTVWQTFLQLNTVWQSKDVPGHEKVNARETLTKLHMLYPLILSKDSFALFT